LFKASTRYQGKKVACISIEGPGSRDDIDEDEDVF
jgi:hypothetical protein